MFMVLLRVITIRITGGSGDGEMAQVMERMTKQRRVILDAVKKATCHPTADDIYQHVRKHLPRISLATVYRNLEILAEAGEISKVELSRDQARWECRTEPHCHLRCTDCGCVRDAPVETPECLKGLQGSIDGFEVTGYCLQVIGVCPDCRERQN